ncbi:MAG: asparagine synthetase B, partial [Marivirga sp.]|nr:asparagine synthetase B [Marivirga sp.]
LVLGENSNANNVRYIYGELGRGHWTYYSGHDPEGSPGRRRGPTDLNQYPHSPGYRLILNNVLFPSAKKKKQKT